MPAFRRLLAVLCIVAVVGGLMMSAGTEMGALALVPLDPLFGVVVSIPVPQAPDVRLSPAPVLSVRSPRAPPLA
jgi:hypothetical protein